MYLKIVNRALLWVGLHHIANKTDKLDNNGNKH